MIITEIKTTSHEENWKVCNELLKKGFVKSSDCMWAKIFRNENEEVRVLLDL